MDRWANTVAVVTGASSGIGAAVAKDLVQAGLQVVALARRENRLQEIRDGLPNDLQKKFHPIKCDVSNEQDVKNAFEWVEKNLGGTDILINNAGTYRVGQLTTPDNSKLIEDTVNVNVLGAFYCVREAFQSMKKRNFDGHVVIVNSVLGHSVPNNTVFNIYPATKYAITAMTETYRQEFASAGTKVKITSISPGLVDTEIIPPQFLEEFKKHSDKPIPILMPKDISDAILYTLSTPPHVQVHELTIQPVGAV